MPIHTPDDEPEGARGPFARRAERVGRPFNIFGAVTHSPAVLAAGRSGAGLDLPAAPSLDTDDVATH